MINKKTFQGKKMTLCESIVLSSLHQQLMQHEIAYLFSFS